MSLDFTPEKLGAKFSFTAVCKDLEQVMSRVNGAMAASSSKTKYYFVAAKKGKLAIIAYSQDTFCCVRVSNATSEKEGLFAIEPTQLAGIIKGRANMDFTFNGSELEFKLVKGKYNGSLTTLAIQDEQLAHIKANFLSGKKDEASTLSRDLLASLKEGMSLTNVKDVYGNKELASHITLDAKLITVSAFDTHHFALFTKKVKTGFEGLRVVLPINHFNIIDKMVDASDKDSKFVLRAESIRVQGSNFLLVLPAIQTEEKNFTIVQTFLASVGQLKNRYKYKNDQLLTLVDNLYTLNAVNATFEVTAEKGGLQFTFATQNGSARDTLKADEQASEKGAKIKLDPPLFRDTLSLAKGQKDTLLSFSTGKRGSLRIECKTESGANLTLLSATAQ